MRAAASAMGDKLRRRMTGDRRPADQTDHTDDTVSSGTLAGSQASSGLHPVGSSGSLRSNNSMSDPGAALLDAAPLYPRLDGHASVPGAASFGGARPPSPATRATPSIYPDLSAPLPVVSHLYHPAGAHRPSRPGLADAPQGLYGAPPPEAAGGPGPSSPGPSSSAASSLQQSATSGSSSAAGRSLRVLCSSGGAFAQAPGGDLGRVYQGGTTRLLNLDFAQDSFSFSSVVLQISQAGLAGDLGDDEALTVSYELPGEHGVYVTLTNDEDLAMMYEEWLGAQTLPGPTKKLRLFVETSVSPAELGGTPGRAVSSGGSGSDGGRQGGASLDDDGTPVLVDGIGSLDMDGIADVGAPDSETLIDLLQGRMEIIAKPDVSVSKLLGAGGYGEVYLGKWREATDVAVKCLSPALVAPDGDLSKLSHVKDLMDEARLLFSLRHPNIVFVYGIVLDKPGDAPDNRFRTPAIITEYMASGSLRVQLGRNDHAIQQGWVRVVIALDAARGMEYLHSKQIVHFDLKSGNLLLAWRDRRPTCKVADFGLSKQRRQTYVSGVSTHTGTLPWTAPEILHDSSMVNEKVDLYSFAIVMWELWTSEEPHAGIMYASLLHRRMTEPGLRPPVPGTPDWDGGQSPGPAEPAPGWRELMEHCWAESPADRPSFQEVVTRLKDMLEAVKPIRRKPSDAK